MKTNIFKISLLLIVLSFSLLSCGKDDDHTPPELEIVTATVKYSMADRYDLSKLVDMKVYYTSNDGKEANEVITAATWEKTLTKAPVPGIYQVKVTYARNEKPLEQDSYKFGTGLTLSFTTSSGNMKSTGSAGSVTVSKSKVEEYLKKFTEEKASIEVAK